MNLLDVLNSPWAILPAKLNELTEIYNRHLRGDGPDSAALDAMLGAPEKDAQMQIIDGVALLPVDGPLMKKANLFTRVSGATSMQLLASSVQRAIASPDVKSIVLVIDSPGGTVDGTEELGRVVYAARASDKPIVAWVDGLMASAAYWIGSAADAIYIGSATDTVGSIGVAAQHVDYSRADEKAGIKITDIYAGQYKRVANENQPLSSEGRDYLQSQVDYLYSVFVNTVARNRGVGVSQVLAMADGKIFIGKQAIDAGLVDGSMPLEALISQLGSGTYVRRSASGTAGNAGGAPKLSVVQPPQGDPSMDLTQNTILGKEAFELRCEREWVKSPALQSEFLDDFESFFAYQWAEVNGKVKILGRAVHRTAGK